MKIGKRTDLEHYSVAELVVQAGKIAKGKGVRGVKDAAWIVVCSDKHKLITYIANEGGDGSESPPRAKDVPHWKKGR
jgi:hypothetical protein